MEEKKRVRKSLFRTPYFYLFCSGFLGLSLCVLAKTVSGFADGYYEAVYRPVVGVLGTLTGLVPCSLAELFIVGAALLVLIWGIGAFRAVKRGEKSAKAAFGGVLTKALSVASAVFFLFSVFCGVNYYRESFAEKAGFSVEKTEISELYDLCAELIDEANELSMALPHDENGLTVYPESDFRMAKKAREEYQNLYKTYPFMAIGGNSFGTPKPVTASFVMSDLLISGVFSPYTLEANVCREGPDFLRGATMMHEQSHLRGFMNEAEANFIAYLACEKSADPYFRYSGTMLSLLHSMNALYAVSPEKALELAFRYNERLHADFAAQNAYVAENKTVVSDVSDKVNDTYLKLNAVKDGVQSYGKMVDLLIAYRKTKT